jgi:NitT/TauT family transport system permease protein
MFPRVDLLFDPYVDALNSMPRIAFAPIFILAFGIGPTAKIALAFTLVVFILLMNARSGVKSVDPDILQMATVQNGSRRQLLMKVVLPSSVPAIFAGLRLGLIYALLAVVASEMIASRDGLGQLITKSSAIFQLEYVYAVVLMLALIAAAMSRSMASFENHLLRWQRR